MNTLARFARLSRNDKAIFLKAALLVFTVRIGLWILPFGAMHKLVSGHSSPKSEKPRAVIYSVERIVWAVTRASRYVPGATCLTQAIAAQKLLTGSGHPSSIRIGVAKDGGIRFQAHAWVISGGQVVIGGEDVGRYQTLLTRSNE